MVTYKLYARLVDDGAKEYLESVKERIERGEHIDREEVIKEAGRRLKFEIVKGDE